MVVKIASCIVRSYDLTMYTHGADLRSPEKYDFCRLRGIGVVNRNSRGIVEFHDTGNRHKQLF